MEDGGGGAVPGGRIGGGGPVVPAALTSEQVWKEEEEWQEEERKNARDELNQDEGELCIVELLSNICQEIIISQCSTYYQKLDVHLNLYYKPDLTVVSDKSR